MARCAAAPPPWQTNRDNAASKGLVHRMEGLTDEDGMCSFTVPPESAVRVACVNDNDFEDTATCKEVVLSADQEQFIGFALQRVTRVTVLVQVGQACARGITFHSMHRMDQTDVLALHGGTAWRHCMEASHGGVEAAQQPA